MDRGFFFGVVIMSSHGGVDAIAMIGCTAWMVPWAALAFCYCDNGPLTPCKGGALSGVWARPMVIVHTANAGVHFCPVDYFRMGRLT